MPGAWTFEQLYAAFNARRFEDVLARTVPDVDWPDVARGERLHGHDAVLAYWRAQLETTSPVVHPVGPERLLDDGRVAVRVHQQVRSIAGELLVDGEVTHVYALRDGLVARMDVEPA